MKIIQLEQRSPEWLEYRRNKIGATDCAPIMRMSDYKTPYKLWAEKIGLLAPEPLNSRMQYGIDNESRALADFEQMFDLDDKMRSLVFESENRTWQIASMDGYYVYASLNVLAVEIKCSESLFRKAMQGEIPDMYRCQMQHQMCVLDIDEMYYFAWYEGDGKPILVKRDQEFIDRMIIEEYKFWKKVKELEVPALSDKDYIERSDREFSNAVSEWKSYAACLKTAEIQEQLYRKKLLQIVGENNARGCGVKVSKVIRRGAIEYNKIPQILENIDVELYRKPNIETWRITQE
mgnify:CR=1 FL=1